MHRLARLLLIVNVLDAFVFSIAISVEYLIESNNGILQSLLNVGLLGRTTCQWLRKSQIECRQHYLLLNL